MGCCQDAIDAFDRALELDPNSAEAALRKGVALHDLGRHEESLAACEKAIELNRTLSKHFTRKEKPLLNWNASSLRLLLLSRLSS